MQVTSPDCPCMPTAANPPHTFDITIRHHPRSSQQDARTCHDNTALGISGRPRGEKQTRPQRTQCALAPSAASHPPHASSFIPLTVLNCLTASSQNRYRKCMLVLELGAANQDLRFPNEQNKTSPLKYCFKRGSYLKCILTIRSYNMSNESLGKGHMSKT